ncbi:type III-A CRISPR-associated RAMP protein Csm3 [Fervidobacterium sp. 2310opik-2]|uniref:type III-A CRISPR-associated RAMP protein Csm3 n=1 Tax=Fervidobacterium sp. 2310opik-2 TaxID=1755815 RepID=UPI0013DF462B|nr:type III-A CRISPR-associated RAMP protein Csm3 [Fervidobacterium sp. 2310opik-2]KAF2961055.1 hypothetical protein AS161_03510 [Fervidobacterium sp. 2310opik-2]
MSTAVARLNGKFVIRGVIRLLTGMRIGGTEAGFAIGGVDNPIIRNPLNGQPYIPGSSLKGKMRSLSEKLNKLPLNREHRSGGKPVRRHECDDPTCVVCRVYGASDDQRNHSNDSKNIPGRIIVRDAHLTEESIRLLEMMDTDTPYAEIKSENTLDRITSFSSPRQTERVPAGVEFEFEIIYTDIDYLKGEGAVQNFSDEDILNILKVLELIEEDYIGGSGSRGYGRVKFEITEMFYKPSEYYIKNDESKVKVIIKEKTSLSEAIKKLKEKNV